MEFVILLVIVAAVVVGAGWSRRKFGPEIDRAKRIRRANRDNKP